MMVSRPAAIFVTFLALSACDGKKAGTSTEIDTRPLSDGVSDTMLEVAAPVDVIELHAELTPETVPVDYKEAEGNCHYDCLPGWYTCEDGEMIAAFYGPIPCWVGLDCEEAGNSWPCVSGVCGPHELCMDDIEHLECAGAAHSEGAVKSLPYQIEWMADRLAGVPLEGTCEINAPIDCDQFLD